MCHLLHINYYSIKLFFKNGIDPLKYVTQYQSNLCVIGVQEKEWDR